MLMRRVMLMTAVAAVLAAAASTLLAPAAAPADDDPGRAESRRLRRTPVVEVFEDARDAVVNISATEVVTVRSRSPFDSMFGELFDMPRPSPRMRQYTRDSLGSGFVIHPDGYIVTNAHVVSRTSEQRVTFADGREYDAHIVAADTARDLAVLRVHADSSLPTLPLGRSNDLMQGETVIAIGNPLGFKHTVTSGVVSAVDRDVAISRDLAFEGLIQTDASINPGNSGGPLLNALGELIGINTAIRGDAQNIGFAIPVDRLREILPDLLDVERRYRLVSGLAVDHLAEPRITEVQRDTPADEAGIRPGDVLLAIDERPVHEGIDFDIALINRQAGEKLDLTLKRGERSFRTALQLAARPAPDGERLAADKLGIEVYPVPPETARDLGLSGPTGLLVTSIEQGGPADEAGVERRDILLALGRHYLSSIEELGQLLEKSDSGDVVSVRVLRLERRGKVQLEGPLEIR